MKKKVAVGANTADILHNSNKARSRARSVCRHSLSGVRGNGRSLVVVMTLQARASAYHRPSRANDHVIAYLRKSEIGPSFEYLFLSRSYGFPSLWKKRSCLAGLALLDYYLNIYLASGKSKSCTGMPLNPHLKQKTINRRWATSGFVGAIVALLLCAATTPEATDMAWRCSGGSNKELVMNLYRSMHTAEVALWCHFTFSCRPKSK